MAREELPRLAGRGGLPQALWRMRRFLSCAFVFSTFDMAMQDPLNAFLYSMVECPAPAPDAGGVCPEGAALDGPGVCVAEPRSSPSWSLSAHCADKDYVVRTATQVRGAIQIAHQVASIVVLLFAGHVVDLVGRRPVLMAALLCQVAFCGMLLGASFLGMSDPTAIKVLLTMAYASCGAAVSLFSPAANAMVADLSGGNASLRGDGFAALGMISNVSLVVGFAAMYPILSMHLTDYTPMWACFLAIAVAALAMNGCLLPETLPAPTKEEDQELQHSTCKRAMLEVSTGFRVVAADPFLCVFVFVASFATMAAMGSITLLAPYQVVVLQYGNAKASVCGMLLPVLGMLASGSASPLIRRCGAAELLLAVLVVAAAGVAIVGGGAAAAGLRATEASFWVGVALAAVSWNLMKPCFSTIISSRVAREHQGNVFAFQQLIVAVMQVSLGLLWPEVLFDAGATGLRRGAPFLTTAAVLCLCAAALCVAVRAMGSTQVGSSGAASAGEEVREPTASPVQAQVAQGV